MIVVIEVARCESNIVVATHLTHERLLLLHLHLLRVRSQIGDCKIYVRLMHYFPRHTLTASRGEITFRPGAPTTSKILWFVSPNQLERTVLPTNCTSEIEKLAAHFSTARHFPLISPPVAGAIFPPSVPTKILGSSSSNGARRDSTSE